MHSSQADTELISQLLQSNANNGVTRSNLANSIFSQLGPRAPATESHSAVTVLIRPKILSIGAPLQVVWPAVVKRATGSVTAHHAGRAQTRKSFEHKTMNQVFHHLSISAEADTVVRSPVIPTQRRLKNTTREDSRLRSVRPAGQPVETAHPSSVRHFIQTHVASNWQPPLVHGNILTQGARKETR